MVTIGKSVTLSNKFTECRGNGRGLLYAYPPSLRHRAGGLLHRYARGRRRPLLEREQ